MKDTVTMDSYVCDGCGKERLVPEGGDVPDGLYGAVREISPCGGSGMEEWYACGPRCAKAAVMAAAQRAWEG